MQKLAKSLKTCKKNAKTIINLQKNAKKCKKMQKNAKKCNNLINLHYWSSILLLYILPYLDTFMKLLKK